ncbi:ATP-dependent DNA helicase [Salinarchaeum laminariae]|uniref:ATP-dependent DNA helicase n=1 Tax=Salinarchaeum laminariae TaxID=869888 RepID=UPI0020BEF40B|nr:helicase C-terminal domain-containing protein [Salinarchaeum laminariae]
MTESSDWETIFGHDTPYEPQVDGIETALDTARDGGYLALEGACGTGKTMLALTAGLHLVRDESSEFERVVVLTSVKQQLRQFEQDLRLINDELPEKWRPFSGLTLVGKADVCPYSRERAGGIDEENVYDRCEGLRDRTRALTGEDGETSASQLVSAARRQQIGLDDGGGAGAASYLETAGEPAPYPRELPEHQDEVEYCPFYAQFLDELPEDGEPAEAIPFEYDERGLMDTEDLVGLSVEHGTCPHSMMGALLDRVEVVLGNYYHAFDPTTASAFTAPLLDDETFVICDEAHMLEPRVRDLVSDGVADATLRDAEAELTRVIEPLREGRTEGGADEQLVRTELASVDLTRSDLESVRSFVRDLRESLDRRVVDYLNREHSGWRDSLEGLPDEEIPLRPPESPQVDEITEWASRNGHGEAWHRAEAVGAFVGRLLDEHEDEERERAAPAAGRTLAAWARCDHEHYFRSLALDRTWDATHPPESWRRAYNGRLNLHNCVPGDAIGDRLADFGGGVLMSATLAPLDVFAEVSGLEHLQAEYDRPVETRQFGLEFPVENRESFAVAAPKFTYDNRGPPPSGGGLGGPSDGAAPEAASDGGRSSSGAGAERTSGGGDAGSDGGHPGVGDEGTRAVRRSYLDAMATVAGAPGNVLVGMPSYAEAEWAAAALDGDQRVDKQILLDESSADAATQALKDEFFAGEPKVLVTSLRGTLTEGVDYRGDRLSAAVVCGVPIVDTSSPRTRAIRASYDRAFGGGERSVGFEYSLTIPAVRKARQAIGRVIRGPEEVGVRVFVDERYAREDWDSVRQYLPAEFDAVSPDMLEYGLERFWDRHGR